MADRYLSTDEVCGRTGYSRGYVARLEQRGEFPRRRRIGRRRVAWLESEIDEWMRSRPLADDVPPDPGGDLPRRGYGTGAA